jgi:molybdopterin converting factor small subunit
MRRATELVVDTYDYLSTVPETASILGWENGAESEHLEERRRFFTVWMARVLGLDTSDELAYYLFRAGKFHAGHGPRHIIVPPAYITTSIGMMGAAFARCMSEAHLPGEVIGPAMIGWNKYLSVQLHMMLLGYEVARELERGDFVVPITLYGRLRDMTGRHTLSAHASTGDSLADVLRRFFSYSPQVRQETLQPVWHSHEKEDAAWIEVYQTYTPRPGGWRILLNGRNVAFGEGFTTAVQPDDIISIFPPGR